MAKAKSVTVWRDDAGGEHDTQADAERASELIAAEKQFREAQSALNRALLNTAKTGCGRSFDVVASGHYWEVRRYVQQRPWMRRVWIWPHDCTVVRDCEEVRYRADLRDDRGRVERIDVAIGDLYATEAAARARYLELWREYAAEVAAELSELEASHGR